MAFALMFCVRGLLLLGDDTDKGVYMSSCSFALVFFALLFILSRSLEKHNSFSEFKIQHFDYA